MAEPLDTLALSDDARLAVVSDTDGPVALPMVRDGQWRRARAGDGAAEALLGLLARSPGATTQGAFTVQSFGARITLGERAIGVDQTNESVIVGDAAVVKWATHLQDGPHPAPRRLQVLTDAGFTGMPRPWGLVTWQPPRGAPTMVAYADEYLPAAVDGWTWAVDMITDAVRTRSPAVAVEAATQVGALVAELHAALAATATAATAADALRWRDAAMATLETVCALPDSLSVTTARVRRSEIGSTFEGLGSLGGTVVIEGHGDLHVGQVLRTADRFVVTDFDGNPILPAAERMLPIPAVLDVAGMAQSLTHAAIVARKHTVLDATILDEVDGLVQAAFLDAYSDRLARRGHARLYDPDLLRAFRIQQVLREIIYATRHLPRWMYVPDAALAALLDDRRRA